MDHQPAKLRLRPHHMFCESFSEPGKFQRGEAFDERERLIMGVLQSGLETVIEVIEGVDDLCEVCPLRVNNRCESPAGNEEPTRKWDVRILQGLEIAYGYIAKSGEVRKLIAAKAPLNFCWVRCPRRDRCQVFRNEKEE